jgi:hypothetical protein
LNFRRYRAALAVTQADDSRKRRQALFKDYDKLKGIDKVQRIGASFVTPDDLRDWFDALANKVIAHVESLPEGTL